MVFTTQLNETKPESVLGKIGDVAGDVALAPIEAFLAAQLAIAAKIASCGDLATHPVCKLALDTMLKLDGCNAKGTYCK